MKPSSRCFFQTKNQFRGKTLKTQPSQTIKPPPQKNSDLITLSIIKQKTRQ